MISFVLMSAALAASPEAIVALDSVEHFTVDSPFDYPWMAGALPVQHGTLFVIEIGPGTAHVAQVGGPVLYVGSTPAALTHPGTTDAHLVAFVPQHLDLSVTPVFWGPTDLPERVTQPMGQTALAQAAAKPFSTTQVQAASLRKRHFSDEAALYGRIAELIEIHAPADSDFAHGYSLGANR